MANNGSFNSVLSGPSLIRVLLLAAAATVTSTGSLLSGALPIMATATVSPPHPIGYRAGVTGRLGDLGPRLPGSLRGQANPCNRTATTTTGTGGGEEAEDELYDVCDGPYSFVRCRGRDPLLIADCIPKPKYRCWIDPEEAKASCGKPELECVTDHVSADGEVDYEADG
ncbi:uncharacterized protein B0I36DRAFT_405464 [Microdochium trichocladiopsis]|uniref:Uncharacterized protein n=1 Tax=Microdochium trichocladiopsis TaxID=1682393 RepID=A0A9P9BQI9_9PEZI|nr:uncharacterized protein B0I36DRAFT_405464 [Microdochium trichocladiopsis]KAH7034933.1 hypothetical protein B0I36DRAFT_405464 [Microdochium trichocladiopsis]